ncbi:MAG: hypothetical protein ACJAZN_003573, partial [Planctomycetota bacterium]
RPVEQESARLHVKRLVAEGRQNPGGLRAKVSPEIMLRHDALKKASPAGPPSDLRLTLHS